MSLYAIGDLHLCLGAYKPMDVFGGRWEGYMEKLREGLSVIAPGDTTVLLGDLSWALGIEQAEKDFAFLHEIPGRKIILKGNHDYWWSTVSKMKNFFTEKGLTTLDFLHNNCALYGDYALCGTRGWFFEEDQKPHNAKVLNREVGRLETSLKAAEGRSIFCFLHYPPLYQGYECPEILELLERYGVRRCYYGHIHSNGCRFAFQGEWQGVQLTMVSADYLAFMPKKIG